MCLIGPNDTGRGLVGEAAGGADADAPANWSRTWRGRYEQVLIDVLGKSAEDLVGRSISFGGG